MLSPIWNRTCNNRGNEFGSHARGHLSRPPLPFGLAHLPPGQHQVTDVASDGLRNGDEVERPRVGEVAGVRLEDLLERDRGPGGLQQPAGDGQGQELVLAEPRCGLGVNGQGSVLLGVGDAGLSSLTPAGSAAPTPAPAAASTRCRGAPPPNPLLPSPPWPRASSPPAARGTAPARS